MAEPIKTTPRKKWHRKCDKWQARVCLEGDDYSFLVAYPTRPGVWAGQEWEFGVYEHRLGTNDACYDSEARHGRPITWAQSLASLRRIV